MGGWEACGAPVRSRPIGQMHSSGANDNVLPMTKGDTVRMSERLKTRLRGKCGETARHLGPFDPDDGLECWGCSSAHVTEFGDCIGVVQGPTDFNHCEPTDPAYDPSKVGPEVDVRWQPTNLRYAYHPEDLELISLLN